MNDARKRRDNLQRRIRVYRSFPIIQEPPPPSEKVHLCIYGKRDDMITSGDISLVGVEKKLNEMQTKGFWTRHVGRIMWVAPYSITRVVIYPTHEQAEEPIELRQPPSKDSFKSLADRIGSFFDRV